MGLEKGGGKEGRDAMENVLDPSERESECVHITSKDDTTKLLVH